MRKSVILSGLMAVVFLAVIGTGKVFGQEFRCNYLIHDQASWEIPERFDESELTEDDREELENEDFDFEACEKGVYDDYGDMTFFFSMTETELMELLEEEDFYTNVYKDGDFIIGVYEEVDGVGEMAINLTEFIIEYRWFELKDNPFFEESDSLYGISHIVFKKTNDGFFVPEKMVNTGYDELPSGMPYKVTYITTYLYYERTLEGTTIVKTGNENLYNDCMGYDGIKEIQQTNLKVYPNPAKEQITISLSAEGNENVDIRVFNMLGVNVLSQQAKGEQINIDVQSLPAGVYAVRCVKNDNVITKRFVKQ